FNSEFAEFRFDTNFGELFRYKKPLSQFMHQFTRARLVQLFGSLRLHFKIVREVSAATSSEVQQCGIAGPDNIDLLLEYRIVIGDVESGSMQLRLYKRRQVGYRDGSQMLRIQP